jgi:hypothetical protein
LNELLIIIKYKKNKGIIRKVHHQGIEFTDNSDLCGIIHKFYISQVSISKERKKELNVTPADY